MIRAAAFLLILTLAACTKHEPPVAAVAAPPRPSPSVGAELARSAAVPAQPTVQDRATPAVPAKPAPAEHAAGTPSPGNSAPPRPDAPPPSKPAATAPVAAPPPAPLAPVKSGEALYADNCATCHMADGNGVPFMQPGIQGSAWISNPDPQLLLSLILRGATVMGEAANAYDNKMPPLDSLNDAEIAAVATYVRGRFAAAPIEKPVTPAEVASARKRPGLPQ